MTKAYLESADRLRKKAERLQRELAELHAKLIGLTAPESKPTPSSPPRVSGQELVRANDAGMSRREWRAAIKRGDLRARKIGREYVATRADFDEYLAARQVAPALRARRERPVDPAEAAVKRALASGALRAVAGRRK